MAQKDKSKIEILLDLKDNSKTDYTGENLAGLDLQDKNFTGSCLANASLLNSNLSGADFTGCDLTNTNFRNSNLSGVTFSGALRNKYQIVRHASIILDEKHHYAFFCKGANDKTIVLINELSQPEHEYKQSNATTIGRILYQLLVNTK